MVGKAGTGITETVECAFGFEAEEFAVFFLKPFGGKDLGRRTVVEGIGDVELVQAGPLAFVFMRSLPFLAIWSILLCRGGKLSAGDIFMSPQTII